MFIAHAGRISLAPEERNVSRISSSRAAGADDLFSLCLSNCVEQPGFIFGTKFEDSVVFHGKDCNLGAFGKVPGSTSMAPQLTFPVVISMT